MFSFPSRTQVCAALAVEHPHLYPYTRREEGYRQAVLSLSAKEICQLVLKYQLLMPSQTSFVKFHGLNGGNFSRWLRGKKESRGFLGVVQAHLLGENNINLQPEKAQENCRNPQEALAEVMRRAQDKERLPLEAVILLDADNYPTGWSSWVWFFLRRTRIGLFM